MNSEILELIEKKDYATAKDLIRKELIEDPQNFDLHKHLGLCNMNLGCFDDALSSFKFLLKINPADALAMYYTANIYIEKNQYDEAEKLLKEVIKLRPEYYDAYKSLTVVYMKKNEYDKVFELGHKFLEKDDKDVQIYDLLAAAAMENAGFDLAVDYLKKAVDIEPENPKYITKLGIALFAAGRVADSIECYLKSLKYNPDDTQTLYNLGLAYFSIEEYSLSYKYLKQAYDNNMESCLSAYALAAYKAGFYKESIQLYNKLIEIYPDQDNFQYNLACAYDGDNDPVAASKIIERLLTFNMNSVQLKLHLASLYSRLRKTEAAKVLYSDVISQGFVDSSIMYEYAVLCAKTDDSDKAEDLLKEIIKVDPNFSLAYKDLAIIYTSRRLFDQAEEYFNMARKVDPNNIYVLFEIANYYNLMADFEKASKVYSKLLKMDNVPYHMYVAIAKNYISMNKPKKARKILFDLFEKDPSNIDVLFYLAQVLMEEEDYQNAQQLLEAAYTIAPNEEIANMLANVYVKVGEYEKAYSLYKVASIAAPSSITLMLAMADCKCRQKQYDVALEHIRPVLELFPEHETALEILERIKKGE